MKLFEAIVEANRRAPAGGKPAAIKTDDFADSLPLVALTCIDARLNPLVPDVFGVPADKFVWLRNAGNIITNPTSSTMRSLALACAVKNAREIAIVGHTDCQVANTNAMTLTDRFEKLGVPRQQLPENLREFFGLFASERQNVLNAVEFVRKSPLIGPRVPVHGLLLDTQSGRLEWLANGYEQPARETAGLTRTAEASPGSRTDLIPIGHYEPFQSGEISLPKGGIGSADKDAPIASPTQPVGDPAEAAVPAGESLIDRAKQWASEVKLMDNQTIRETVAQVGRASVATVKELVGLIDRNKKYRVIGSDMKEYGPIAGFKLIQWLMEDRITPDSPVRLEDGGEWQPLKNLVEGVVKKHVNVPPPLEDLASRVSNSWRNKK